MVSLHDGVTVRNLEDDTHRQIIQDRKKYKRVVAGDIAYNMMRMWQGAVGVCPVDGLVSPAYVTVSPAPDVNAKYYEYVFRLPAYMKEVEKCSRGIVSDRNRLYWDDFKQIPSPYPPRQVQDSIVAFLDRKLKQIDCYLATKRRQIELLDEARVVEANRLVTRGLKTHVSFNRSDVMFVHETPSHWETLPLSAIARYVSYGFTNPMPTADTGPWMLTANDIGDGEVRLATARRTTRDAFVRLLSEKSRPKAGDLLITKDGTLGRVAVCPNMELCINQSVAVLRLNANPITHEFVFQALRTHSYQQKMIFDAGGTTIKHIYISRLIKMKLAVPPKDEQCEIIKEVRRVRLEKDKEIEVIRAQLRLMTEYRTALIAGAVTGRLDVRRVD